MAGPEGSVMVAILGSRCVVCCEGCCEKIVSHDAIDIGGSLQISQGQLRGYGRPKPKNFLDKGRATRCLKRSVWRLHSYKVIVIDLIEVRVLFLLLHSLLLSAQALTIEFARQ